MKRKSLKTDNKGKDMYKGIKVRMMADCLPKIIQTRRPCRNTCRNTFGGLKEKAISLEFYTHENAF